MKLKIKIISYLLGVVWLILFVSCTEKNEGMKPVDLTVSEGFSNPIGFYDSTPTFSWKLPVTIQAQSAYSIVAASEPGLLPDHPDIWQSGKVESDQSIFAPYQGPALNSRQRVYWQVKYWDNKGNESQWSEKAFFELGLLKNEDWQAKWISIPQNQLTETDSRGSLLFPPQYFRKEVEIKAGVKSARLHITSKGVFESFINGKKVGDDIMPPGWVPYQKFIPTRSYDVTDLLKRGINTLGVVVAEGWYAGRINLRGKIKTPEHTPQLLYQLEIEYNDGSQSIVSDNNFKVSVNGPIRTSKIYDGETYDANYEFGDWHKNGFDDSDWLNAVEYALADSVLLSPKPHSSVKDQEILRVKSITTVDSRKAIFDFGQNNVGVPLVKVPMKKGDTLTIRFAEMLDLDGSIYTTNYRSALSTDHYIASKNGVIEWKPIFTFHGYRYIEISGYDPEAKPVNDWVNAVVQYSDFELNGTFVSSHDKLNKLQSNIKWGLLGNFFDIPTDCPQRDERLGWTGDAQVIAPTSIFNAKMYPFWNAWLQSMRAEQRADGSIPNVIPNNLGSGSSSGWGDACVIIPWELYFRTGDTEVLEENYEMMLGWIDFYKSKSTEWIVEMISYADWLQPYPVVGDDPGMLRRGDTPFGFINTAYFARSVELAMRSAEVLSRREDVRNLQMLHEEIKAAFQSTFFDADGRLKFEVETQTGYLTAIAFGLLDKETEKKAKAHLIRVIAACDNHLRTGFLGTPILPLVLDQMGEIDLMYTILFQETYPSWFYSINQGATTMWERWDSYTHENGFHKEGMNSFNHYAYGAIGRWMYERIAGIKPVKPGYKEIEIAPIPGGPLTSAEATYDSPYGMVRSSWKMESGSFKLSVTVPPNTTAKIVLPGDPEEDLLLEGSTFFDRAELTLLNKSEKGFELRALPGTYSFESKMK